MIFIHDQTCEANSNTAGLCNCGLRTKQKAHFSLSHEIEEMDFVYREQIKALQAQLEKERVDCIRLQQEINCLRMEPCQLQHCLEQRADWNKREAELRVELDSLTKESSRWYDGWAQAQADRDAWRQIASKMQEALSWISEEYERGERKGYDMKVTPQMNGLAKEALAAFAALSEGYTGQPEKPS